MDIRSLQCFCFAYESGTIGKAAKRAYLSRQGLSQVLKNLEAEINQPLFVRNPQGLEPTDLAHTVYPKAVELLKSYDAIQDICFPQGAIQKTVRLSISFGALISIPFDDIVEQFYSSNHNIRFEFSSIEPTLAERCIAEDTEDLALIVGNVSGATTQCVHLCNIPLYAAVHESLLPQEDVHSINSLKGLTWFGLSKNFALDSSLIEASKQRGLDLVLTFDWPDYHLIMEQVKQRRGACFIPKNYVHQFCQDGIIAIPLQGQEFSWEIGVIVPNDRPLSRSSQAVLDWLKAYF